MPGKYNEAVVVEDNGGGLTLFVFDEAGIDGGQVIYSHTGYEYIAGQLRDDIDALMAGESPTDWDGCEEDPQAMYDELDNYDGSTWHIVARVHDSKLHLETALFGAAAAIEFGDKNDK